MQIKSFEYKIWADKRTLDAISMVNRTEHEVQYAFMCQQLNHILIVEDLFRSRLESKAAAHDATNSLTVPDFEKLSNRLLESGSWFLKYSSGIASGDEGKVVSFQFADGKFGAMSIEEILFHIVNHGSYHRGSIARALDLVGEAHPADGYGIFIHQSEPQRRNKSNQSFNQTGSNNSPAA